MTIYFITIFAGAGFYTIFDFYQKYYVNPPCLIGENLYPAMIGWQPYPRRAGWQNISIVSNIFFKNPPLQYGDLSLTMVCWQQDPRRAGWQNISIVHQYIY
jgi:hypothetical protein